MGHIEFQVQMRHPCEGILGQCMNVSTWGKDHRQRYTQRYTKSSTIYTGEEQRLQESNLRNDNSFKIGKGKTHTIQIEKEKSEGYENL